MCKHIFIYPQDKRENYNPDGLTLTGQCKCGVTQIAYGMRWSIPHVDKAKFDDPAYLNQVDKNLGMC